MKPLEILAFAPHPDDAEIFCGGTLAKLAAEGKTVGVIDLTLGELGSQGTVEGRQEEVKKASALLKLSHRANLKLEDGGINPYDEEQLAAVVKAIRQHSPEIVLFPTSKSRHPDHEATHALIRKAVFLAGLKKFKPELGASWQILQAIQYRMRFESKPSFVCDTSEFQALKMQAVACYASQVIRKEEGETPSNNAPGPLISSPLSVRTIETIDRYYGAMIATEFAEAFYIEQTMQLNDPLEFFRSAPLQGALNFSSQ